MKNAYTTSVAMNLLALATTALLILLQQKFGIEPWKQITILICPSIFLSPKYPPNLIHWQATC